MEAGEQVPPGSNGALSMLAKLSGASCFDGWSTLPFGMKVMLLDAKDDAFREGNAKARDEFKTTRGART
jgi:hypothetical protein